MIPHCLQGKFSSIVTSFNISNIDHILFCASKSCPLLYHKFSETKIISLCSGFDSFTLTELNDLMKFYIYGCSFYSLCLIRVVFFVVIFLRVWLYKFVSSNQMFFICISNGFPLSIVIGLILNSSLVVGKGKVVKIISERNLTFFFLHVHISCNKSIII